jgi:hypothetical protein
MYRACLLRLASTAASTVATPHTSHKMIMRRLFCMVASFGCVHVDDTSV